MTESSKVNPYYETEDFNNSFNELVELSKVHYETGIRKGQNLEGFAEDLYSEVGHYIYELLQNADDAHATNVEFRLLKDSLSFSHDGPNYFTFENIKAITTYGGGEKSKDSTKIGRFGIGFKATSRITENPQIRSNQFAFQILNQVIPEKISSENLNADPKYDTTFNFPFGGKLKPEIIRKETLHTLLEIDSKNLLFLNHINTMTIIYFDGAIKKIRILGKTNVNKSLICLRESLDGNKASVTSEYYLRYIRNIDPSELQNWANQSKLQVEEKNGLLSIAVAIRAEIATDSETPVPIGIVADDSAKLYVFFPAKKELTGLKFHIHAPFAATTTRESIKDASPVNDFLFKQFALLLPEVLNELVNENILTVKGLEVFPNSGDEIRSDLAPMRDAIYSFFKVKKNRIPRSNGGYLPLENFREVSKDISALLTNLDLRFIGSFDSNMQNDANILEFIPKPNNVRSARFLTSLRISNYSLHELVVAFSHINGSFIKQNSTQNILFVDWFSKFDFKWIGDFYALLGNYDLNRVRVYFTKIPIIRIASPIKMLEIPEKSFFSKNGEKTGDRFVHSAVIDFSSATLMTPRRSQIWRFLEAVGVKQYSKSMLLEEHIEKYRQEYQSFEVSEITPGNSHREALRDLLEFIHGDVELERAVKHEEIFLTEEETGELGWHSGNMVYTDSPFQPATGLDSVMPKLDGLARKYRLWSGYAQIPNITAMLKRVDVTCGISPNSPGNGFMGEWTIPEFEKYLEFANTILRRNIWNYIKSNNANRERHFLKFPNSYTGNNGELSSLAIILKKSSWIPDKTGNLKIPSQIDQSMLGVNFLFEKCDFLDAIGFGADSAFAIKERQEKALEKQRKDEAASLFGVSSSEELEILIKAMRKNPKKFKQLIEELNRPELKDHIADPLKLGEVVRAMTRELPEVEIGEHSIYIREGTPEIREMRKTFLRATYLVGNVIACQICSTSSFIKRTNGEAYFEAIMVIPGFSKNSEFNVIALCGQCAAKFKWGKSTPDDAIKRAILDLKEFSGEVKINVVLGGEPEQIKFVESHFVKLKGALSIED